MRIEAPTWQAGMPRKCGSLWKGFANLQRVIQMLEEISEYLVAVVMQVTFATTAITDYQTANRPESAPTPFSRLKEHTGPIGVLLHEPRRHRS